MGQIVLLLGLALINRFEVKKTTTKKKKRGGGRYLNVLDNMRVSDFVCVCVTVCERKQQHGPWKQLGACQAGVKGAHKPTQAPAPIHTCTNNTCT